jgi:hypothetical protein
MDLATHQRKLLGLVRATYQPSSEEDPYIQRVAGSRELAEAQRNILLWRVFVLERTCVLTFALLTRKGLAEDALTQFIARCNISPFRETQAPTFLEMLSEHPDDLVASVAQFELALQRVSRGEAGAHIVRWSVDPAVTLHALARELPFDESAHVGRYETVISGDIPGGFRIDSLGARV